MGPVSFTHSATVAAPIDKVFDLISDPMRMPEWLPRCVGVKPTTNNKAPGKGADPRKFKDVHDRAQWDKLHSLPNLMYTDGNAFSLWRPEAVRIRRWHRSRS